MNERIKELADKAGIGQLIHVGHGEWDTKLSDKELKFAELIVRECATVIEQNLFRGIGWNTSRAVKRHFGLDQVDE